MLGRVRPAINLVNSLNPLPQGLALGLEPAVPGKLAEGGRRTRKKAPGRRRQAGDCYLVVYQRKPVGEGDGGALPALTKSQELAHSMQ